MNKFKITLKRLSMLLVIICISFSIIGCSKGEKTSGFTDFNGIEKEYLQELKNLNWPEGYTPPKKLEKEGASTFQEGFGVTRAQMLWECVWEKEWLKYYKKDPKRAEKALKELEKVPGMLYMSPQKCDDATRKYFDTIFTKAKLGDPSGFEENIRLNCPE